MKKWKIPKIEELNIEATACDPQNHPDHCNDCCTCKPSNPCNRPNCPNCPILNLVS